MVEPARAARSTETPHFRRPRPRRAVGAARRLQHCHMSVKKHGQVSHGRHFTDAMAAMEQMELYCEAHPGSPVAVRHPRLFVRGELWIALLGPSVEEGIVGIGPTVTAALRAFDAQYLAGLRPAVEPVGKSGPPKAFASARRTYRNSTSDSKSHADPSGLAWPA